MRGTIITAAIAAALWVGPAHADGPAAAADAAADERIAPTFNFDFPVNETLRWDERFTLSGRDETPAYPWEEPAGETLRFKTGSNWGLTLGFDHDRRAFDMDSVRAGAFLNITPRMRIGGQFSFSSPDDPLLPEMDEDAPEVKLESAFRF